MIDVWAFSFIHKISSISSAASAYVLSVLVIAIITTTNAASVEIIPAATINSSAVPVITTTTAAAAAIAALLSFVSVRCLDSFVLFMAFLSMRIIYFIGFSIIPCILEYLNWRSLCSTRLYLCPFYVSRSESSFFFRTYLYMNLEKRLSTHPKEIH